MTRSNMALAVGAWFVGLLWLVILVSGGGKSVTAYQKSSIISGAKIEASSTDEIWSGWWSPTDGYRLSTSLRPDLIFGWSANARSDCAASVAAFLPDQNKGHDQQLAWRLNSGAWHGPLLINGESLLALKPLGDLVRGTNILTFRLPDARVAESPGTRLLSIALRSVEIDCPEIQ